MGKLLCEKNLRDVWCRNESVRAEIGPILQTHTHTHTRVSYSSIDYTLCHKQCTVNGQVVKKSFIPVSLTGLGPSMPLSLVQY